MLLFTLYIKVSSFMSAAFNFHGELGSWQYNLSVLAKVIHVHEWIKAKREVIFIQ